MKILYLHGLLAVPNPARIAFLEGLGHTVTAPQLFYPAAGLWQAALAWERPDFIVGFSMGGLFGDALGRAWGVPVLSFNPALPHAGLRQFSFPPPEQPVLSRPHHIVLGLRDEIVDPAATARIAATDPLYRLYPEPEMPHRAAPAVFERYAKQVLMGV